MPTSGLCRTADQRLAFAQFRQGEVCSWGRHNADALSYLSARRARMSVPALKRVAADTQGPARRRAELMPLSGVALAVPATADYADLTTAGIRASTGSEHHVGIIRRSA